MGLNFEQVPVRAYRKCGGSTALFFLGSEPFFFSLFPSFHLSFPFFPSFSIFYLFFTSFLPLFLSFSFFISFYIFLPLFSFFFLFPFLFRILFRIFRWPGRGRSLAALPCLPLPYLTLHLLSSPSLTPFFLTKKKEHRDFQQISVLSKKFLPTKKADHFKVYPYVQLSTLDTNCHSKCIMAVRCVVVKART